MRRGRQYRVTSNNEPNRADTNYSTGVYRGRRRFHRISLGEGAEGGRMVRCLRRLEDQRVHASRGKFNRCGSPTGVHVLLCVRSLFVCFLYETNFCLQRVFGIFRSEQAVIAIVYSRLGAAPEGQRSDVFRLHVISGTVGTWNARVPPCKSDGVSVIQAHMSQHLQMIEIVWR